MSVSILRCSMRSAQRAAATSSAGWLPCAAKLKLTQRSFHSLLPFSLFKRRSKPTQLIQPRVAPLFVGSCLQSVAHSSLVSGHVMDMNRTFQIHKVRSYNFAANHPQATYTGNSLSHATSSSSLSGCAALTVPSYMSSIPTYAFCYLSQIGIQLFDNPLVANFILFGQMNRLISRTLQEIQPGDNVIQVAHVYGKLANRIMERVGEKGQLTLIDIAQCQVDRATEKLSRHLPNAALSNLRVQLGDACFPPPAVSSASSLSSAALYDKSVCFFLLHEVPSHIKHSVVRAQLRSVSSSVIFVDYHRPHRLNPFRPLLSAVLDAWEPYAKELWQDGKEVWNYVDEEERKNWEWKKSTIFGGFYQIVVAHKKQPSSTKTAM